MSAYPKTRVLKYGTGDVVPENAIYLWSCVEQNEPGCQPYRYVWHYFRVPS